MLATRAGALETPTPFVFTDVDGNRISTFDGHVSLVAIVTRTTQNDARTLADRVPRKYYGDPHVRLVTVINFQGRTFSSFHPVAKALIRRRLDAEAERLRPEYAAKHLSRDPRQDLFVVADFDGEATARLGVPAKASGTVILVIDGEGKVMVRWNVLPSAETLAAALARTE